jgi:MFS transporter, BCD family, chlorophyll transporter
MKAAPLTWLGIVRLGLVQAAIGAVVVLTTSTLNRIMIVEYGLPAFLPGALVAFHYGVQFLRPRFGHGSDVGRASTPWIVGGMAVLAAGGIAAAAATALMGTHPAAGIALAIGAFAMIGIGVGAAGTSLLVLLSSRVAPARAPGAAALVWIMMFAGFGLTATVAGKLLDPYSGGRLIAVATLVALVALLVAALAVSGMERGAVAVPAAAATKMPFRKALVAVWSEMPSRRFTVFVFVAMVAYSAQELILEPFAGALFRMTPGQTTQLGGMQHGGSLFGMIVVAVAGARAARRSASLAGWTIGGCAIAAGMLLMLALRGIDPVGPLSAALPIGVLYAALGVGNGIFAGSTIGRMMLLVNAGPPGRRGTRMGLWGAAQAVGFCVGDLLGTGAVDVARAAWGAAPPAYATVFAADAALFLAAALIARCFDAPAASIPAPATRFEPLAAHLAAGDD